MRRDADPSTDPQTTGYRHDARGYWLREAGGPAEPRPLSGDARADVAIVGGGYAGLWTAWAITSLNPGARVMVLEAGRCGEGPSGRNAGFANGLWHRLEQLTERFGERASLEVCSQAAASVEAIGEWATERGVDAWYRRAGHLKVSIAPTQDGSWESSMRACERLGAAAEYVPQGADEVRARCDSPLFRSGALSPGSATVQPARLVLGLREALVEAGVEVHELTRARRIGHRPGTGVVIETERGGRVTAPAAVLAIGPATAGFGPLRNRLAVSSTHMLITEPVPDLLEEIGWSGGEAISTAGRYLNYFRTTPDGRIAFGWGGGRIAYGARLGGRVEVDPGVVERVRSDLVRFFPGLRGRRVAHAWGGPVDVSPNHFPSLGTLPGGRIHFVHGFTGNGVGPAHLAGRVLAAMALDRRDELTGLAIVEPPQAPIPPEPLRFVGGTLVRAALLRSEARELAGRRADPLAELVVDVPRRLGIHIGR